MPEWAKTARSRGALRAGRTDWYRIRNAVDGGAAQVMIYDEIGYWGVTASDLVRDLAAIDAAEIDLHISSPGGEIFDGIAIMNALRAHRATVTTYVDSLAASIASVIAMSGDRIVMAPHSQMMIHDGSGVCVGNSADMRELAELLDRQSDNIADVYASRAGGTRAQWRKRMQAETWFTATEAVAAGLADEVAAPRADDADEERAPDLAASWDLSVFRHPGREHAPAPAFAARAQPPTPPAPDPAPAPAPEPARAPEAYPDVVADWDPAVFRAAVTTAADDFAFDADLFRAALTQAADNAPAPTAPPPAPEPAPDPYDPVVVTRALKEAMK